MNTLKTQKQIVEDFSEEMDQSFAWLSPGSFILEKSLNKQNKLKMNQRYNGVCMCAFLDDVMTRYNPSEYYPYWEKVTWKHHIMVLTNFTLLQEMFQSCGLTLDQIHDIDIIFRKAPDRRIGIERVLNWFDEAIHEINNTNA